MIHSKTRTLAGVMLRSGSTYREVSDALEISVGSVHNISREDMDYLEPLVMEVKRRAAFKCYLLADHVLSRMSDADFERADLKQKSIAAGILYDKGAMLEGIMPKPDEKGWDESRPGEMGRLYWPGRTGDALPADGLRVFLMSLWMQGREADARRIGRIAGMKRKDIEACANWQEEFDPPATREESRQWKRAGRLRKDYDDADLPMDEEEKNLRRIEERLEAERRSRACDDLDDDGNQWAGAGYGEMAEGIADMYAGLMEGDPQEKEELKEAIAEDEHALGELNRIEQALRVYLAEKQGELPGPVTEN